MCSSSYKVKKLLRNVAETTCGAGYTPAMAQSRKKTPRKKSAGKNASRTKTGAGAARRVQRGRGEPVMIDPLGEPVAQADGHRRTREAHASEIAEDYVEAIAGLIASGGEARVVDVARCLGVSHVTVVRTIARLQESGLVTSRPYRAIFLTGEGQALADRARHRHTIVLEFLLALGVSRAVAEADSEGIEHHVSDETLAAFQRFVTAQARRR